MFSNRATPLAALLALLLPAISLVTPAMARGDEAPETEAGFTSLFDGKSLAGWSHQTQTPKPHVGCTFFVRDGLLVGDQGPEHSGGFLMTDGVYKDFDLLLDLQMDYPTDSGLFIRMADDGKSQQITLDNRPKGQFGSIYIPWAQGRVHANPEGEKAFKQGEWNKVRLRVEGEPARIRFWLNDILVTDFQHTDKSTKGAPTQGRIALQVHPNVPNLTIWKDGNTVRYRNIRVKSLNALNAAP
ncbi:DUF1080 domain-containing protein [Singulisphaera sp. Ch08]|uniref:DUF1080 domain-containing protein n=1 Tax=Singulisphaera sp. Ch08 TaxID=3120278 RepID=A0AAU7CQ31_9BACT